MVEDYVSCEVSKNRQKQIRTVCLYVSVVAHAHARRCPPRDIVYGRCLSSKYIYRQRSHPAVLEISGTIGYTELTPNMWKEDMSSRCANL